MGRFFLSNTAPEANAGTALAGWNSTSGPHTTGLLHALGTGTNTSVGVAKTSATNYRVMLYKGISPAITSAGTITGGSTITLTVARLISNAAINATLRAMVYVLAGNTSTVRGTLFAAANLTGNWTTTATATTYTLTTTGSFSVSVGDRLVIELGYNGATSTTGTGTLRYGGGSTGTPLAAGTTGATANCPWFDYPTDWDARWGLTSAYTGTGTTDGDGATTTAGTPDVDAATTTNPGTGGTTTSPTPRLVQTVAANPGAGNTTDRKSVV